MTKGAAASGSPFVRVSLVGRGASAEVFRGRRVDTGADVAIKRLHAHLSDAVSVERFEREARLLASIQSPHVVRYLAHGLDDESRRWLALEWLDGEDLARRMRRQPLTRAQVLSVVHDAALALDTLHALGIVHRDVKPANFFVSEGADGIVSIKLLDLGIARASVDATVTQHGVAIGTPTYMSPEQARGEDRVGPRADVFSLGVMLFELLSGQKPYQGDDMFAVLAKIVMTEPPRLSSKLPGVSAEIDAVVARAMAKSPDERYASALELAGALVARPPSLAFELDAPVPETAPSAPGSTGSLSAGLEQRVVTAVFALLGPGADAAHLEALEGIGARHGAAVHRTLGRRRVLVFGEAASRGDEPVRAARAALEANRSGGLRLSVVTARVVADGRGLSGHAIERGTVEVERSDGRIRVDEATRRLLGSHFVVDGGEGDAVLTGELAAAVATGPRLLGRETPFVGRERELASLIATFDQSVGDEVARAIVVVGGLGTGKSRLRYELLAALAARPSPPRVLLARGDTVGAGSPFGLAGRALRRYAGVLDGEPVDRARAKLRTHLAARFARDRLDRAVELLAEIASLGDVAPDGSDSDVAVSRPEPMLLRDAIRGAWEDWLRAECDERPVLLVFEDLQWGDRPSVLLVDHALRNLRDRPLCMFAFARPEIETRFPDLWAQRAVERIVLHPLGKRAAERLVRHALPDAAEDDVRRVVERAEGNAFFLEELIRAVSEGGDHLPETVLGLVQARLDALGASGKRVLRAASVFGRTFWRGGVETLVGEPCDEVLDRLVQRETVSARPVASVPGESEYVFRHALVRDAAYAMLTDRDRTAGHRLAADWLAARAYPDAFVLAEHFARGGEEARAISWYRRAAEQALEGDDFSAAVERAERGVACGASGRVLGELLAIQTEAHRWRGELSLAERRGVEALALLPAKSAVRFRLVAELAVSAGLLGHIDRVEALGDEILAIAPPPGLESEHLTCLCRVAIPVFWAGRHEASNRAFARIDALASASVLDPRARGFVHFTRATRAAHASDPERHVREQQAAVAAFEEAGDRRAVCTRGVSVGFAYAELGELDLAEEALRRALQEAQRMGLSVIESRARSNLGNVLRRLGRVDDALAVESLAVEACFQQGDPRLEASSRVVLAQILLDRGQAQGAEAEGAAAARLASNAPGTLAAALAVHALALVALGRTEEAVERARRGVDVLDDLGRVDELEGLIRIALPRALEAAGAREEARAALAGAHARLMQRAQRIRSEPRRQAFLERIAEHAETISWAAREGIGA